MDCDNRQGEEISNHSNSITSVILIKRRVFVLTLNIYFQFRKFVLVVVLNFTTSPPLHLINRFMKNYNMERKKLLLNEYATLASDLTKPIISLTKSQEEFVVEMAMTKYPIVTIADKLDPIPTKVRF